MCVCFLQGEDCIQVAQESRRHGEVYERQALYPVIYGAYEMALMKDAPKEINVVLLENSDYPGGVGEPPLGPIGAAIANAVYRLTGKRVRRIPLRA
mgnify:CR=1 FL=1